jgi:hypothetical protein
MGHAADTKITAVAVALEVRTWRIVRAVVLTWRRVTGELWAAKAQANTSGVMVRIREYEPFYSGSG